MIRQKIGLKYLVPLELETLVTNPFVEGDFFMGDLLEQVLKVDKEFWNENEDLSFSAVEMQKVIMLAIDAENRITAERLQKSANEKLLEI